MTMPAPPPDTRAAGQSGHIADHNTIADALTALDNAVGALQAAGYLPMPSGTPQAGQVPVATGSGEASAWGDGGGASLPMTTLGDTMYENATPAAARLPGTTSATKHFLTQTGTGSASAAPAWGTLASGDIPDNAANTSGTAAGLSGTPALPNGTTATTQSAADDSTKVATTAYADGAAGAAQSDAEAASVSVTGGGKETVSALGSISGTATADLADGNVFTATMTADVTFTFSGATSGKACSFDLWLSMDGTGGWTPTWPGSVTWIGGTEPALDTAASALNVMVFESMDGGTTWHGSMVQELPSLPLSIANGGTGQNTQSAAMTALAGSQVTGYYLRSDGTNTYLQAIAAGDVPTLNQNTTGTAGGLTGGPVTTAVRTVTSNYTLVSTDSIVFANASGGSLTVTVPAATGIAGQQYYVVMMNSTGGTVTVHVAGETIAGFSSVVLGYQYESIGIVSDGANWQMISSPITQSTQSFNGEKIFNGIIAAFGGLELNFTTQTANYSIATSDVLVLLNGTTLTATLPDAGVAYGNVYTVKLIASGTTATINCTGSQKIDGASTYSLPAQNAWVSVQSDGANWRVISSSSAQTAASCTGNAATATNLAGGATFPAYVAPTVSTLSDGSSVALNAALGNSFTWPLAGSSHTLAAPSNPVDGQSIKVRIKYSGSYTPLFNSVFDFGAAGQPSWSATSGKTDIAGFEYDASLNGGAGKWAYLGSALGLTS